VLLRSIIALAAVVALYLLAWPVTIDPVAWNPPQDKGLVDPFAANEQLAAATGIDLGECVGPEDAAEGPDGYIYVACENGNIDRFAPDMNALETFARVGGRPLGLEFDEHGTLFVANAYLGLQMVERDGTVTLLTDSIDGRMIRYADDVDVAADGSVYFSDASSKFGPMDTTDTMAASILEIMEHAGNGRVLRYDPTGGQTTVVMSGLAFSNGVAISEDQQYLLVIETGEYRVWRHWLDGERKGQSEVILDNLPAFPDNVNNGMQGRFWIGLVSPRDPMLDDLGPHPFLRKVVMRLPESLRPAAVPTSHVISIDGDGNVLMSLQDSAAAFPVLTGVLETETSLYLTSLYGNRFGRLHKAALNQ
jgi:sugar lactone lactonase YvrE